MSIKKIGLMGCGVVASYGHLPALQQTKCFDVHALYDPNEVNLRRLQAAFNVPHGFTDLDAFLDSGIEAVTITSPATCHCQNVLDAVGRRLPVLVEKPLAMNEDQAQAMIAGSKKAGVMLFTGLDYRFSPISQTIRQLVRDGAIGQVRSLRLIYVWDVHGKYSVSDGQRVMNQRRVGRMLEGGPLVDCGVHQIDLARYWLGSEVVHMTAAGAWVEDYDAPDHAYIHMDHAGGQHTMVEISYSYGHTIADRISSFSYDLIGTDGLIRFDRERKIFEVRTAQGITPLPFAHEKNFPGMYKAFAAALETGNAGELPTGEDGWIASRLATQATEQLIAQRAQMRK